MPDPRLAERVKEFIGGEKVARQYWPERLEVIGGMARTPSGKIQKFVLRDQAQSFTVESDR